MPVVDVDNNFNTDEDKIQLALGTMQAYSINVEHICKNTIVGVACYPGIIALTCTEALAKFLQHISIASYHSTYAHDLTVRVSLCE